jgi:hypothetical protein
MLSGRERPAWRDALGIELIERAAEARGRLLKVERQAPAAGAEDTSRAITFQLTFDVGRISIGFDHIRGSLVIEHLDADAPQLAGLEDLAEADPWWRILGNSIVRAWPSPNGEGAQSATTDALAEFCMQFREDADNPKLVALRAEPSGVRVLLKEVGGG